jgi:hypothetical protein
MSNPGGLNLNIGPYFDDFDEDKKFVRVLYVPGRAVQARELTQSQSITQKQIQRFADYFFREGSIIEGCEQSLDLRMEYVKLQSNFGPSSNTIEVDVEDFKGKEIVGANTGLRAYVGLVSDIEGNDPKTLFINYASSGSAVLSVNATGSFITVGNTITFNSGNTGIIKAFYQDPITSEFRVFVGNLIGSPDPLPFTATHIGSDGNPFVLEVGSVLDKRTARRFENSERIFALIDDISDSPNTAYANAAIVSATSTTINPGLSTEETFNFGSKFTIKDGTIYVADHFIKHDNQTIILDKYTNRPSYKVGVIPVKSFVDTVSDQTLLDNAQGTPNFQALGADRLRIDTLLSKVTLDAITDETEFVPITEIVDGATVRRFTDQPESRLEDAIAKRTFEESGNYTLTDPRIFIREHLRFNDNGGKFTPADGGNNELLIIETDPFTSYVKGYRNELLTKIFTPVRKGTDTQLVEQVKTGIIIGSFLRVKEFVGSWDIMESTKVELYDEPQQAISNTSFSSTTLVGSKIGEARVRAIEYNSGDVGTAASTYNMYMFDVVMNTGKLFQDVRSVHQSPGGGLPNRFADVVVDALGNATLRETAYETAIFELPFDGIKTIRDDNNNVETGFQFKKEFITNFSGAGQVTIATTDLNETFASGGTEALRNNNYTVIPTNTANTTALTGTANTTSGSNIVSSLPGGTTAFTTQFQVGDVIRVGTVDRIISSIANNFFLTVTTEFDSTLSNQSIFKVFPAGRPIKLTGIGSTGIERSVATGSPPQTVVINLQETGLVTIFGSGFAARVVTTMNRANAREVRKILNVNRQVQIDANTHPNGLVGPYGLGFGDVFRLKAVHQSSDFDTPATTSNTNVTSLYTLDNGQRDTSYEHGTITPLIGVKPTGRLLAVFDHFVHDTSQGVGYLSFDSYPVNDVAPTPTTIRTEDVPIYNSTRTTEGFSLRDSIDFRPIKSANNTTINPLDTGTFTIPAGGLHFPTPGSDFDADLIFYKGRKAKLYIDENGELGINDGSPGYPFSSPPPSIPDTLELAEITIPVYPSLPKDITINSIKNRRFTMREIGRMNTRLERIEYYTKLNELERQTQSKVEIDGDGFDRFKNGILVDRFQGHNIGNVLSPDYRVAIDTRGFYGTAYSNNQVQLGFQFNPTGSSNVRRTPGNKLILDYDEEVFIDQPFASTTINLAEELLFVWNGDLTVIPATDNWVDTTIAPEANSVVDLTGITDNFRALTDSWNTVIAPHLRHWVGETPVTNSTVSPRRVESWHTGHIRDAFIAQEVQYRTTITTQQEFQNEVTASMSIASDEVNSVTERVSDIGIRHYFRPRDFIFISQGMKDSVPLFAFFDGENVTANCTQIRLVGTTTVEQLFDLFDNDGILQVDATKWTPVRFGNLEVENNRIIGVFRVPAGKFFTGQRTFRLTDSPTDKVNEAQTLATTEIFAQGLSVTKGFDIVNTRPFTFNGFANQRLVGPGSVRNITLREETTREVIRQWADPLSQSFYVDEEQYPEGVYVSSIDLFFKTKSASKTLGTTVELREMQNGFPARRIIGNEVSRRENDEILLSDNSTVPTVFEFKSPVFLPPGQEYCWVAKPDGNVTDFNVFVATLGEFDLTQPDVNFRITEQPATGMLFTSANDYTWVPRQNQDVKYKMKIASFKPSGTVILQNKPWANTGGNFLFNGYSLNIENLVAPKTNILLETRTADQTFTLDTFNLVKNLERVQLPSIRQLANTVNEELNLSIAKSVAVRATLLTANRHVSPYIDMQRMAVYLEQTIINNKTFEQLSGSVEFDSSDNIVVGTGTQFTTEIEVGEFALFGEEYRQVSFIANNEYLEVKNDFATSGSGIGVIHKAEENPTGPYASETRYITRVVELNDGFESSDLSAYLSVNRQPGTDIKVYYKVLNENDNDPFDFKFYNEMQLVGNGVVSQNSTVYSEEKYIVPDSKKTGGSRLLNGRIATENGSVDVNGTNTVFLEQLQVGAEIAVGTSRIQRRIASIANNTFLTVETPFSATSTNQEIYRILNNSIGYTTPDGRTFSGFKFFAIKIVFLSSNPAFAPKVKDLRVIALA